MVDEFLHNQPSCGRARCNCVSSTCSREGSCDDTDDYDDQLTPASANSAREQQMCDILQKLCSCTSETEFLLLTQVSEALGWKADEISNAIDNEARSDAAIRQFRRPIMKRLRQAGYNAAICKSKWNDVDGFPAGDYEYIDVLMDGIIEKRDRFIVDIDFKSQFEIARPSSQYSGLLKILPNIFVGRGDRLKKIIKIMSDATKSSLKKEGLHLPPWRKQRYMQAKWFSFYRRTTKEESQKPVISVKDTASMNEIDKLSCRPQLQKSDRILQECHEATEVVNYMLASTRVEAFTQQRKICTAMCTEWQLPAPNAKKRGMVSGLANALRESGTFSMTGPLQDAKRHMVTVVS